MFLISTLQKNFVIPLEVGLRYIFYHHRSAMFTVDRKLNTEYIYTMGTIPLKPGVVPLPTLWRCPNTVGREERVKRRHWIHKSRQIGRQTGGGGIN